MGKQFADVNCKYGAPMGRDYFGIETNHPKGISLFQVNLVDGGYDDGGAYWGTPNNLYCARDTKTNGKEYQQFTRAKNRREAAENLGLEAKDLARTPRGLVNN